MVRRRLKMRKVHIKRVRISKGLYNRDYNETGELSDPLIPKLAEGLNYRKAKNPSWSRSEKDIFWWKKKKT